MLKSNSSPIDDAIRNYCNARNLSAAVVFFSKVRKQSTCIVCWQGFRKGKLWGWILKYFYKKTKLDSMPPMPPMQTFYFVRQQYQNTPCGGPLCWCVKLHAPLLAKKWAPTKYPTVIQLAILKSIKFTKKFLMHIFGTGSVVLLWGGAFP